MPGLKHENLSLFLVTNFLDAPFLRSVFIFQFFKKKEEIKNARKIS